MRAVEATAPAPVGRLVSIILTRDELTTLLHVLDTAKDEARKATERAENPNPAYRPLHPDTAAQVRKAARDNLARVTDLLERVDDCWKDHRP